MTPSNVERLSELLKWRDTGKAPDVPHEMMLPDECGRVYFENGYCAMLSWDRVRSVLAELEADKRRIAELEDERDEFMYCVREDASKWSFDALVFMANRMLEDAYPEEVFGAGRPLSAGRGPAFVNKMRDALAELAPPESP